MVLSAMQRGFCIAPCERRLADPTVSVDDCLIVFKKQLINNFEFLCSVLRNIFILVLSGE